VLAHVRDITVDRIGGRLDRPLRGDHDFRHGACLPLGGEMPGNQWPVASCDADFAPYLAGKPEASVALFGRFVELARAAGPVIFERTASSGASA
jgi:hypothetical protein